MQLTITEDQIKSLTTFINTFALPFLGWILRKAYFKLKLLIGSAVIELKTDIVSELKVHLDEKFAVHEKSAFKKIDALEETVNRLEQSHTYRNPDSYFSSRSQTPRTREETFEEEPTL